MHAASSASDRPGAEILGWPAEGSRRAELVALGVPRLLVLEPGAVPPDAADELEDWIWLPADERDVFARLRRLAFRRPPAPPEGATVRVGSDGVAWVGGTHLPVPPAEGAILRLLADPPERLCLRDDLAHAAWGEVPHSRRSLDSRIFVLRRRLAPHGLLVRSVRGRGFILTAAGPDR